MSSTRDRFLVGGTAAGFAEFATLPIDLSKVRLQTQMPLANGSMKYTGMMQTVYTVTSEEGPRALWKGLSPAMLRQCSYTGLSMAIYTPIRDAIAGDGVAKEDIPFHKRVLSGGLAGGASIILMNPTDVVKTQMQSASGKLSIVDLAKQIWTREGLRGFWKGTEPNVARCFIGNACEIGCYDQFKTSIVANGWLPEGPLSHLGASTGAGIVSSICSTPADVVKTRLMNQAGRTSSDEGVVVYKGVLDAFWKIPSQEGLGALYKGFLPLAARKVTWTVVYFMAYERLMYAVSGQYS
mmetsp:Transcript_17586/g.21078  ORF Transcript_17586/g.21078 Transcript_17586/m.21078 type:complete len:295 (-) Transcript_17586:562-1446(-)|eukprot:CAMPEP_0197846052 /NCGR_PEP_ID=MMETSP1438-20131217/2877_1 /TAXON_ID=1461541 /ORGANISM="Pterosperma sp., Strain CCMP1384" /LENGTH=294 /DNA_ID=CAMNT_0043457569 /DNA_START=340 /DNA_END=1227 /DNA_ORIENTATION=+